VRREVDVEEVVMAKGEVGGGVGGWDKRTRESVCARERERERAMQTVNLLKNVSGRMYEE
jgi:hypothetical protein